MPTKDRDWRPGSAELSLPSLSISPGEVPAPGEPLDEPESETWRDNQGALCAYATSRGARHTMVLPGLARFVFDERAAVVQALADPGADERAVRDAFYRAVLPMALHVAGGEALHASAVRAPGGVVALCARSETGKSTLAYGLSRRGYDLWADDVLVFDVEAEPPAAIPTPFRLRLRPASATFFGRPAGAGEVEQEPAAQRAVSPLAAICVLERSEGGSAGPPLVIEPLAPLPAFSALLTHAYCYSLRDRGRKRLMVGHYLELARRVPVFAARFRPGLGRLPGLLDGLGQLIAGLEART